MARRGRRKAHGRAAPALQLEELEPRLLLSADPVSAFAPDTFTHYQSDTDTPDYQQLIDDLLTEVFVLDNTRDGVAQITETLQVYSGVDAIHLTSHGR